jgi:hypothetical protein
MDLSYSAEEQAFRNEVREWLAGNLPKDIRDKVINYQGLSKEDFIRWHKILAAKGWARAAPGQGMGRHRAGTSPSATSSRKSTRWPARRRSARSARTCAPPCC